MKTKSITREQAIEKVRNEVWPDVRKVEEVEILASYGDGGFLVGFVAVWASLFSNTSRTTRCVAFIDKIGNYKWEMPTE